MYLCDSDRIAVESSSDRVKICNSLRIKIGCVDGAKAFSLAGFAPDEVVFEP